MVAHEQCFRYLHGEINKKTGFRTTAKLTQTITLIARSFVTAGLVTLRTSSDQNDPAA
jgi:hypothetical protein